MLDATGETEKELRREITLEVRVHGLVRPRVRAGVARLEPREDLRSDGGKARRWLPVGVEHVHAAVPPRVWLALGDPVGIAAQLAADRDPQRRITEDRDLAKEIERRRGLSVLQLAG